MIGASDDDCKLLLMKKFVLQFESGVIVIKHWKVHNYIQKDRYKPTVYQEEKAQLEEKKNHVYSEKNPKCIHDGYSSDTQVRLGKDRLELELELGKDRLERVEESDKPTQPSRHKYGEYENVLLSDEELQKLKKEFPKDWGERIERLSSYIASKGAKYKSHLATIRNWARADREKQEQELVKRSKFNNYEDGNQTDFSALEEMLFDHMEVYDEGN
jgi:hypothetical protein